MTHVEIQIARDSAERTIREKRGGAAYEMACHVLALCNAIEWERAYSRHLAGRLIGLLAQERDRLERAGDHDGAAAVLGEIDRLVPDRGVA